MVTIMEQQRVPIRMEGKGMEVQDILMELTAIMAHKSLNLMDKHMEDLIQQQEICPKEEAVMSMVQSVLMEPQGEVVTEVINNNSSRRYHS